MLSLERHLNFLLRDFISWSMGFASSFFIFNSFIKIVFERDIILLDGPEE